MELPCQALQNSRMLRINRVDIYPVLLCQPGKFRSPVYYYQRFFVREGNGFSGFNGGKCGFQACKPTSAQ